MIINNFLNLIKYLIILSDSQLLSKDLKKQFAYFELFENLYGQIHREVHFCCDYSSLVILKPQCIKY